MDIKKEGFKEKELTTLFKKSTENFEFKFGTVIIEPGESVPDTGFSCHEENEYSIIIEGSIEGESGGKPFKVIEGDSTFIPIGEKHWAKNTGSLPCKIVWTLVK